MNFASRVYLQSNGRTVMVFQMKKDKDSPEYFLDGPGYKSAEFDNPEAIGNLIQKALKGELKD